jgi:hypothetical protein
MSFSGAEGSATPNVLKVMAHNDRSLASCSAVRLPRWPLWTGISEYAGVLGSETTMGFEGGVSVNPTLETAKVMMPTPPKAKNAIPI